MEKSAQYKIVGQKNIPVDKLIPHPKAITPIEDCDRLAIQNSIAENQNTVYLPIIVDHLPDPKTGKHFILDGVNRWKGAVAAGNKEILCDLAETNDAEKMIGEITLNRRKHTTGTRVITYLKLHKQEVLEARKMYGGKLENLNKHRGSVRNVQMDVSGTKFFATEAIAERLGCSKNDVWPGIELLKSIQDRTFVQNEKPAPPKYVENLKMVLDRVHSGATSIRTCLAAAGGRTKNLEGRGPTDWGCSTRSAMASFINGMKHWDKFEPEDQVYIRNRWPEVIALKPAVVE